MREVAQQYVDLRFADAPSRRERRLAAHRPHRHAPSGRGGTSFRSSGCTLKMALTGLGNADAKYVMIDEVQDYWWPSWPCWRATSSARALPVAGRSEPGHRPGTATFDQVRALFREVRGPLEECRLMTSYRSTPEITQLFASLLDDDERLSISSIQRADTAPEIIACASESRITTVSCGAFLLKRSATTASLPWWCRRSIRPSCCGRSWGRGSRAHRRGPPRCPPAA